MKYGINIYIAMTCEKNSDQIAVTDIAKNSNGRKGNEMRILIAGNGLECVSLMRRFVPEALILEQELFWGGSDGVIQWMRNDPVISMIPIIFIAETEAQLQEVQQRHFLNWMEKPYRLDGRRLAATAYLRQHDTTEKSLQMAGAN